MFFHPERSAELSLELGGSKLPSDYVFDVSQAPGEEAAKGGVAKPAFYLQFRELQPKMKKPVKMRFRIGGGKTEDIKGDAVRLFFLFLLVVFIVIYI